MRRAATYLTSVVLLCLLSSFAMAKAESRQIRTSGVQLVAVNNHLPQATIVASPRSATQPTQLSSPLSQHTFLREFYPYDMKTETPPSSVSHPSETAVKPVSVTAKRAQWAE